MTMSPACAGSWPDPPPDSRATFPLRLPKSERSTTRCPRSKVRPPWLRTMPHRASSTHWSTEFSSFFCTWSDRHKYLWVQQSRLHSTWPERCFTLKYWFWVNHCRLQSVLNSCRLREAPELVYHFKLHTEIYSNNKVLITLHVSDRYRQQCIYWTMSLQIKDGEWVDSYIGYIWLLDVSTVHFPIGRRHP